MRRMTSAGVANPERANCSAVDRLLVKTERVLTEVRDAFRNMGL
jgi:hypothetical protein